MSADKNSASPPSGNGRLTMQQTAAAIGGNLGDLALLRHGGPKNRDPTFPPMVGQTFDAAEVMEWVKARDSRAAQTSVPPTPPPPIDANTTPHVRCATPDRRAI